MILRPATVEDVPAITRIYGDAVRHGTASFELDPPDEREMATRMQSLLDHGFPYLVAASGAVLGYAYAGPYRVCPAYRFTIEDSVYVAPEAQRRGIGGALLDALIRECVARNYRLMVAVIGDAGQPSIELHARAGFTIAGTLQGVGYKFDRWLDTVLMQLPLGKGRSAPP